MRKFTFLFLFLVIQMGSAKAEFIKGVTYFGDAWPINFWNSSFASVDNDFARYKKEGFNSIILAVPWGEFQPDIESAEFNEKAYARLREMCMRSKQHGMKLFMRVSYLWDMHPGAKMPNYERFGKLMNDDGTKKAWSRYLKKISDVTSECATGVFISWEDYWHVIDRIKAAETVAQKVELSRYFGYSDWLSRNKNKDNCSAACEASKSSGIYPLPGKDGLDFRGVYEWFDDQLINALLPLVAAHFKSASIEVRVDDDPIYKDGVLQEWFSHKKTFSIKSSEYVFTYWAPAMGAENKGEKNSADEVLRRFSAVNSKVSKETSNKIVIAQLLFEDNTPSAVNNAVIMESEKPEFFRKISHPLLLQTSGYALWGGKDYDANMIYNPSFDLHLDGWAIAGNKKIRISKNRIGNFSVISSGSEIKQNVLSVFNHFKGASSRTFLRFYGKGNAVIEVSYADSRILLKTSSKYARYNLDFPVADGDSELKVKVIEGEFALKDVTLYPFTTKANVRNVLNEPGKRIAEIVAINRSVDSGAGVASEIVMDKRYIAAVTGVYSVESNSAGSYVWASPVIKTKLHAKGDTLEFEGYIPENITENQCDLKVLAEGMTLAQHAAVQGQAFSLQLKLPPEIQNKVIEIGINSSCHVKAGRDQRDLSFILKNLSIH